MAFKQRHSRCSTSNRPARLLSDGLPQGIRWETQESNSCNGTLTSTAGFDDILIFVKVARFEPRDKLNGALRIPREHTCRPSACRARFSTRRSKRASLESPPSRPFAGAVSRSSDQTALFPRSTVARAEPCPCLRDRPGRAHCVPRVEPRLYSPAGPAGATAGACSAERPGRRLIGESDENPRV